MNEKSQGNEGQIIFQIEEDRNSIGNHERDERKVEKCGENYANKSEKQSDSPTLIPPAYEEVETTARICCYCYGNLFSLH